MNVLTAARFWTLPYTALGSERPQNVAIHACCFRERRLWLAVRFDELASNPGKQSYFGRGVLFAVDPDTLRSDAYVLDPKSFQLPPRTLGGPADRSFEIHKDWLYVSSLGAVKRFSLQAKTWQDLPIPFEGHARVSVIDDRLLCSTDDSIFELAPDGKEVRLLASTRRRPAQTALDNLNKYGRPPLLKGPAGATLAVIQGKLYEREPEAADWKELPCPADPSLLRLSVFDAGWLLVLGSDFNESRMFTLREGSDAFDLLLVQPPRNPVRGPFMPGQRKHQEPAPAARWPMPENVRAVSCPACLAGDSLWVFNGAFNFLRTENNRIGLKDHDGRHAELLEFEQGRSKPLTIPVRFELPPEPFPREVNQHLLGFGPGGVTPVLMQHTPKGLVISAGEVPGFWLIPPEELVERRQRRLTELSPDPQKATAPAEARLSSEQSTVANRESAAGGNERGAPSRAR